VYHCLCLLSNAYTHWVVTNLAFFLTTHVLTTLSLCRPLDLGLSTQKNGVLETPFSSPQYNSYRKSPHKITPKSYLSPASSPYCKSDSPHFKARQTPTQPNPAKPFDLSSRHTPLKHTPLPSRVSPFSYNGSKDSTPNLQIPSPYVSGTPPSINGIFPSFSNLDFGLDRYSPNLNFNPYDSSLMLRYPHPAASLGMLMFFFKLYWYHCVFDVQLNCWFYLIFLQDWIVTNF